jgi:hypothetical protein
VSRIKINALLHLDAFLKRKEKGKKNKNYLHSITSIIMTPDIKTDERERERREKR